MVAHRVPLQGVDAAQKPGEVSCRKCRKRGGINGQIVLVSDEPDDHVCEAQGLILSIDVDQLVSGENFQGFPVLGGDARVVVGDEEDDVAVEAERGGEERDQHVGEPVEVVSRVPAGGKEDSRGVQGLGAIGEMFGRRRRDLESGDGVHGVGVEFSGMGFDCVGNVNGMMVR